MLKKLLKTLNNYKLNLFTWIGLTCFATSGFLMTIKWNIVYGLWTTTLACLFVAWEGRNQVTTPATLHPVENWVEDING